MAVITISLEAQGIRRPTRSEFRRTGKKAPAQTVVAQPKPAPKPKVKRPKRRVPKPVETTYAIDKYYQSAEWRILRFDVLQRDRHKCFYCGQKGRQADHVIPRKKGGPDSPDNLVCACDRCNRVAGNNVFKDRFAKREWILQHIRRG